jgi:hypothetical protein
MRSSGSGTPAKPFSLDGAGTHAHQIETNLHGRQGKALANFDETLPVPQSELARQVIEEPYNFDFLTFGADAVDVPFLKSDCRLGRNQGTSRGHLRDKRNVCYSSVEI